jgi:hypothetical protein
MEGKPYTHQAICECKSVLMGQMETNQNDNVPNRKTGIECTSNEGLG